MSPFLPGVTMGSSHLKVGSSAPHPRLFTSCSLLGLRDASEYHCLTCHCNTAPQQCQLENQAQWPEDGAFYPQLPTDPDKFCQCTGKSSKIQHVCFGLLCPPFLLCPLELVHTYQKARPPLKAQPRVSFKTLPAVMPFGGLLWT